MINRVHRNAIVFLLLGGIAVIVVAYVKLSHVNAEVHGAIIRSIAERTQMTLNLFTKPIVDNLMLVNDWSGENRLGLSKTSSLNSLFIPILEKTSHISMVIVADSTGAEYRLYRDGGSWVTRFQDPSSDQKKCYLQRWRTPEQATAEWSEPVTHEPRQEAWYQRSMASAEEGRVVWTPAKGASDGDEWPLVASIRLRNNGKSPSYVVAFKVAMLDLLALKERMKATPSTTVFLVDETGVASEIALEAMLEKEGGAGGGTPPRVSGETVLADAVKTWEESGKTTETSFGFKSGGNTWWGGLSPLALDDQKLWVGALVPQDELLPETRTSRRLIFTIIGAILVTGVLATFLIVRLYGRAARDALVWRRSLYDSEEALRTLIRSGEGAELEFKSTLRWNLKAGRPGKEIEIAWLKTVAAYMNSEGGILLIGVKDSGDILGLDTDAFQNDDKCLLHINNLIKQHIGLEFSPYIRYEILPVGDRKIVAVECTRSAAPVFLKNNNTEEFYIRSGPSSIRLSMSETLTYIQERSQDA